jgi:hypothetical protein
MVDAQKTNIAQNQANLKEQFASMGGLASSPAANAMALYNAQTSADQNSLLGQLQTQALEQAQGRALQAGEFGVGTQSQLGQFGVGNRLGLGEFGTGLQSNLGQFGAGLQAQLGQQGIQNQLASLLPSLQTQTSIGGELLGGGMNLGQLTQGLDQQSIQNLMQEYFMTTPQNNPLNNMMFGLGTTFAPTYSRQGGVGSGLVGSLGNLMSSGANFISSNPWGIFGS